MSIPVWIPDPASPQGGAWFNEDAVMVQVQTPRGPGLADLRRLTAALGGGGGGGGTGRIAVRQDDATIVPRARFLNFEDYFAIASAQDGDQANISLNIYDPATPVTVSIANAGDEVAAPDLDVPTKIVYIDAAANGIVRLPPLTSVERTFEYLFCRAPGSVTATANMVTIATTPPDTMDGRAGVNTMNSPVYLDVGDSNGMGVRVRAGATCWHAVGGVLSSESINVTTTPATLAPWCGHILVGFSGAANSFTLPLLSSTMGSTVGRGMIAYLNAGVPVTINAAGANTIRGSLNGVTYNGAASFPLAAGATAILISLGTTWLVH